MRIGFLGPRGTFSQYAAEVYADDKKIELVEYRSIAELILAVDMKEVDEAVVPLENSIEGSVNTTLDMLAWDVNVTVKREVNISIVHNLMVQKGKSNICRVLSHPQAIGQCKKFLDKNYPNVPIQYTYSTAQAAELVASENANNEQWGAIAAEKAAHEYGLDIIHSSIQDYDNNTTRFIVLTSHNVEEKIENEQKNYKTSIIFDTGDKPGSLYRILQILNLWDVSMTKIESRPAKNSLGKYIFFVDIKGHYQDENVQDAFTMIKKKTGFFKLLGSYYSV